MINILPTHVKEQLSYSKHNVKLRRYVMLTLVMVLTLSGVLFLGYRYANNQTVDLQKNLVEQQKQRGAFKDTEAKVQSLQSNISLIEKLFTQQTKFSVLINDLAAVLPAGTYINNLTLTGDDKKPLKLLVTANNFATAGLVRNALLQSSRISTVDIQSISQKDGSSEYVVDLIIAFKEGKAR
jgi:Tfp pilus assembly protein PilN